MSTDVDYRAELPDDRDPDWWIVATDPAFRAYNQPNAAPEAQLVFVEELPVPLRYALVCLLYDGAINNGGMDLVFSSVGLLLPEIIAALSYYGCEQHGARLQGIVEGLGLPRFPRSHGELMDRFADRYPEGAPVLREAETEYGAMAPGAELGDRVSERIRAEPRLYFR